jgi:ribulose-5-phosphate 4-epimerase/fuculose-1-phosphate aldolase
VIEDSAKQKVDYMSLKDEKQEKMKEKISISMHSQFHSTNDYE